MKKTLWIAISLLVSLISYHQAQAASMVTPPVQIQILSKDGIGIEGVSATGSLSYQALTMKLCGWICIPYADLPHFDSKGDGPIDLGKTDAYGILNIASRELKAKAISAKDLVFNVFTNGIIVDLCQTGESMDGFVDVLPQFIDGQAVVRNEACKSVALIEGEEAAVIMCVSPFTKAEIDQKIAEAVAGCKPVQ